MNQTPVILALVLFPLPLFSAPPPPQLEIQTSPGNQIHLTAQDRGNGSWILEQSGDLIHWTRSGGNLHVRNSVLPLSLAPQQEGSKFYYRLASLPSVPVKTVAATLTLPQTPYTYALSATPPANLAPTISSATINDRKATLGRVLFYDRRLSLDNSVSCSSCHQQEHAFSDNVRGSAGHRGVLTPRNSVSLQHARTYTKGAAIFWDGRGRTLDTSVLDPISHPDEMGLSLNELAGKISKEPYYAELFTLAYGSAAVSSTKIGECLGDFIEAMVSFRSRYDQGATSGFANFTAQERSGKTVFSGRCGSCHPLGSFTIGSFANNGLEMTYSDRGRAGLTGLATDEGKFRVPSLRQVALTAPYMHDGRFATLREVIEFYDHGTVAHPNLTKPLVTTPMNLKETDKLALEAFLRTLTDPYLLENSAFSDPFRTH